MNEAHCAPERNQDLANDEHQITTLKEEMKSLCLENKIKILEIQNEFKIKEIEIENKNKNDTVHLLKEIQSLKSQLQMMKLRDENKQVISDIKFKEENQALKNEIKALKIQIAIRKTESDCKLKEENQTLRNEAADMKLTFEQEKQDLKSQSEKEIQALKVQIEVLNLKIESKQDDSLELEGDAETEKKEVENVEINSIFKGAERFFGDISYKDWYESLSMTTVKCRVYANDKYLVIRKEFDFVSNCLNFVSTEGIFNYKANGWDFVVEGVSQTKLLNSTIFILHPNYISKCLKMETLVDFLQGKMRWQRNSLPAWVFQQPKKSVIALMIFE